MLRRREFLGLVGLGGLSLGLPSSAWAIGSGSLLGVAILEHGGRWDVRPRGLRKMLQEVEKRTSVAIDTAAHSVRATDRDKLFRFPLVFWTGEGDFPPLSTEEIEALALYVRAGGMLVIDSAEAVVGGPFEKAARREAARIVPGGSFQSVPKSHVLYKSFYLVPEPVGRVAASDKLEAMFGEDRALVLLGVNDMLGAWSRDNFGNYDYDVFPGGDRQREMSLRLGLNIVMYALCLDYKEDQVHVPFILKRRKWRVE